MKKKVAICLAHNYNSFQSEFVFSLLRIMDYFHKSEYAKKYEIFTLKRGGYQLDEMRNSIVEDALKFDPDYLLFLDTDITCPEFTIIRMLQVFEANKNCDAVTGIYTWKKPPYLPQIFADFDKKMKKYHIVLSLIMDKPFWIGAAGMGIMMVKSRVFKRNKRPWFKFVKPGENKRIKKGLGEDLYFAWKCKPKMLCDPQIQAGHWDIRPVDVGSFIRSNNLKVEKGRISVSDEQEIEIDKKHKHFLKQGKIRKQMR